MGRVIEQIPTVQSVDDALKTILVHIPRLSAEEIALRDAPGRVLAGDVVAPADLWPFPRSAMDGFAVRSEDVAQATADHPIRLAVRGQVFAGGTAGTLVAETAMRIATGAPVPDGADAVIPVEMVEVDGDGLCVREPVPSGRHIFPAGEDARRGETIFRAGTMLRPGHLGLLASLGIDWVAVVRRARVALLTVGDELVEPGQAPRPGQVRDSNSFALAAAVEEAGGIARHLGIARDTVEDVARRIRQGLEADAVIVCAGMSVGERDVVKEALTTAGVQIIFWRVPMKPGAPAAFGLADSAAVFGLPGTPGAAMVAFEELVRPALRAMMGYRLLHRPVLTGILASPVSVKPGRRRFLWARAAIDYGRIVVQPLRGQGTATLRSISEANALLLVDPDTADLNRGDSVAVQMLAEPDLRAESPRPVLAVVGAKHAGKTFLIERLVPELRRRGYRIAVIKHDVHGVVVDREGTDTYRVAAAGAEVTAISGPDRAAVTYRLNREMPLGEVLSLVRDVDLVMLEGYSQEPVPKIVVRRSGVASDKPEPAGPVVAVVTDSADEEESLTFDDIPALADRIEAYTTTQLR